MINSGLTFGSEGPIMDGTWYNPQTGDSFTVKDSFFEDNQYVVMTTDGRLMKYDQMQNYIKSDKPIQMNKPSKKQEILPSEVADILENTTNYDILPEDLAMINGHTPTSLGNLSSIPSTVNANPNPQQIVISSPVNTNYDIISKALSKRSLPDFQVGIDWIGCPTKEMDMLIDLMDVSEAEIVDWYLSQIDVVDTTEMIKEVIRDYLMKQLHPEVAETIETIAVTSERVEMIPQSQDMNTVAKPVKKVAKKTKK